MKPRRLRTGRLKLPAWPENSDAIAADTSSPAAAITAVVGAAAAELAALSDEPKPATSAAVSHKLRHRDNK